MGGAIISVINSSGRSPIWVMPTAHPTSPPAMPSDVVLLLFRLLTYFFNGRWLNLKEWSRQAVEETKNCVASNLLAMASNRLAMAY